MLTLRFELNCRSQALQRGSTVKDIKVHFLFCVDVLSIYNQFSSTWMSLIIGFSVKYLSESKYPLDISTQTSMMIGLLPTDGVKVFS